MELSPEEDDDLPIVDGCPCLRTTPCGKFCTCVDPTLSGGCRNCAKYGSAEQQQLAAMYISDAVVAHDRRARRLFGKPSQVVITLLALAAFVALSMIVAILVAWIPLVHADPKPGLWQEQVTIADGVTVRKLRDTTGGDFNVCYVASRAAGSTSPVPDSVAVAIACVPEKRP